MLALESYEIEQTRNEREILRLVSEAKVFDLIENDKTLQEIKNCILNDPELYQDMLDDFMLEQVKRDQWNRQYGFLLEQLGYEEVKLSHEELIKEVWWKDMAIDLVITAVPPLLRSVDLATLGISAGLGNVLASLFAGGGAIYYGYHALKALDENRDLDAFFGGLNMLFSLEQASIPYLSDALAAAGRAVMKILGGIFKFIAGGLSAFKNLAVKGATAAAQKTGLSKVLAPAVEYFSSGVGKAGLKGSKAFQYVAESGGKLADWVASNAGKLLESESVKKALGEESVATLQNVVTRVRDELIPRVAAIAEKIGLSFGNLDDALKAGKTLEEVERATFAVYKDMNSIATEVGMQGVDVAVMNELEKTFVETATAEVAKGGAQVIEKTVVGAVERGLAGATAVEATVAAEAGMEALKATYSGARAGITNNLAGTIEVAADGVMKVVYSTTAGTVETSLSAWLQASMKEIAKNEGPAAAGEFYKVFMEGIGKSPQFTGMYTQLVEALAAEEVTRIAAETVTKEGFLKAIVSDFNGFQSMRKELARLLEAGTMSMPEINAALAEYAATEGIKAPVKQFYKFLGNFTIGAATAGTKGGSQSYEERAQRSREKAAKARQKTPEQKRGTIKTRSAEVDTSAEKSAYGVEY